jgi:hypothetical protein
MPSTGTTRTRNSNAPYFLSQSCRRCGAPEPSEWNGLCYCCEARDEDHAYFDCDDKGE